MGAQNSHTIKLLIIEDEVHNSRMLQGMVEKLRPEWHVLAVLESVEDTVTWLRQNQAPDIILLDIQLSDGMCFSIFDQIDLPPSTRIVFTTAYDEYAIRAFKVNSIDYLLKPIEELNLEAAFAKYENIVSLQKNEAPVNKDDEIYKSILNSVLKGKKEYRSRFLISGVEAFHKLYTKDIAYIYSDHKLTFAVDYSNKAYTLDYNLETLEGELDPTQFFRANRKVILNVDSVTKAMNESGGKLKVDIEPSPQFDIIVSRLKAGEFKNWLGK